MQGHLGVDVTLLYYYSSVCGMIWTLYDWLKKFYNFQPYCTLTNSLGGEYTYIPTFWTKAFLRKQAHASLWVLCPWFKKIGWLSVLVHVSSTCLLAGKDWVSGKCMNLHIDYDERLATMYMKLCGGDIVKYCHAQVTEPENCTSL